MPTIEEIEDRAIECRPIPKAYTFPDKWLYLCLRLLHKEYRLGQMTREQAQFEKVELLREYTSMQQKYKLQESATKLWTAIEGAGNVFGRDRTLANAEAFVKVVYGVGLLSVDDMENKRRGM